MNVKNQHGTTIDFSAAVEIMDDEVREQVHAEGHDSEQAFFDAYCAAHLAEFGEEFEPAKENPTW